MGNDNRRKCSIQKKKLKDKDIKMHEWKSCRNETKQGRNSKNYKE